MNHWGSVSEWRTKSFVFTSLIRRDTELYFHWPHNFHTLHRLFFFRVIYFFLSLPSFILSSVENTHMQTLKVNVTFNFSQNNERTWGTGKKEKQCCFCSLLIKGIDSNFTWGRLYFMEYLSKHHMFIVYLSLSFYIFLKKISFYCFKLFLYCMTLILGGTMGMS